VADGSHFGTLSRIRSVMAKFDCVYNIIHTTHESCDCIAAITA
jgi:hypothetical protein